MAGATGCAAVVLAAIVPGAVVSGPVVSAATTSGGWSGASGGGRWPTSHTRPLPKIAAVPALRTAFLMNSRRRRYSASGVISLLGGSAGRGGTGGGYAPRPPIQIPKILAFFALLDLCPAP